MNSFFSIVMGLLVVSSVAGAAEIISDNESGPGDPWPGSRTEFSFSQNSGVPIALTAGVFTCGNATLGYTTESYSVRRFSPYGEFGLDGCLAINSIDWGVRRFVALLDSVPNPITVDVQLYSIAAGMTLEWGNLTLISSTPVVITAADNPVPPSVGVWEHTVVNAQFDPMGGEIDLVVAIHQPEGYSTTPRTRFACSADNAGGQTAYPYYSFAECGWDEFATPEDLGTPNGGMLALVVNGETCSWPPGACCAPVTGTCTLVAEAECTDTWNGAATCEPNPCTDYGACCYTDGDCWYTRQEWCWTGDWRTLVPCDPNPCPPPGVCCYPDGTCVFRLESTCTGAWQGPGGDCDPNPCPQLVGACCHGDGICTFVTESLCSGWWHGQGSTCDPNPCPPAGQHILYVDPSGSPSTYPWFPTIQAALNWELLGPGDEIVLQDGTFTGPGNRGIDFMGQAVTVRSNGDPTLCIINAEGLSRVIQFVRGETATSVLEGVTLTGGSGFNAGAGIYLNGSSPTIRNCRIVDNYVAIEGGGGVFCANASPVFEGCRISNNGAGGYHGMTGWGGGLAADATSRPRLEDCIISWNSVLRGNGAGIHCSDAELVRCTVASNTSEQGGSQGGSGGGILCGPATLLDCTVTGNYAGSGGGGICATGATIRGCTITGNRGDAGAGGIAASGSSIDSCTVAGNRGGGISGSGLQLTDCVITGNNVGGGIRCSGSTIVGCTVSGNSADGDPETQSAGLTASTTTVTRTILWGNCLAESGPRADLTSGGDVSLDCCAVNAAAVFGPVWYENFPVTSDPLFCVPEPCTSAPTAAGDYSLGQGSPCLPTSSPCQSLIGALPLGCETPVGVGDDAGTLAWAGTSLLLRISPNPAIGRVSYEIGLPRTAAVRARLYNAGGRLLRESGEATLAAGLHARGFDVRSDGESPLPAGVYYLRVEAEGVAQTKRLVLVR